MYKDTMRALEIREHGGPDVLVPVDIAEPTPGPGQLLVRLEAAGVNYIDTYFRTGLYKRELPYVPGDEGSGVVESVGDEVGEFVVGQRVAWATAPGSYAEKVIVPASAAVAVPDGVPAEQAASALLQGMTAHYLLKSTYPAAAGDTVLVHAGAGGVGLILTQLAVAAGVRVITTVSTDAKAELSRQAGASEVLKYTDDVPARVRELTDGEGAHAVYDGVGAATFEQSLASLRIRGTLALFGAASGPVPPFDPQRLNGAGSLFLTRPTLAHHIRDRRELEWRAGEVFKAIADGILNIRVGAVHPLSEAATAHTELEGRRTTGSVVLVP
ncbi:NADPH:quinone reductase [Rhodococcus sp. RS1C4]|nr:NADPH:quinone reductase [Rhodococcus sp. RS1C4]